MKNPKFHMGDRVMRKAYKNEKSVVLRDEMTIKEIVKDDRPFCAQMWYVCEDYRGRVRNGLVGVVDDAFMLTK